MGSKRKFWYRSPRSSAEWLFKYPHPNSGEHWAEKVAAGVARRFGIARAEVRLAICEDEPGSAAKSFVGEDEELFHGNQVLAGQLDLYNPDRRFGQKQHTLNNIFRALSLVFKVRDDSEVAKRLMAKYLVFDALIGNTDRHHENWGILTESRGDGQYGCLAPSFDHASSLGRELTDERRERILNERRVGQYSERARGGIFWEETDKHAVSPLELVRRGFAEYPDMFRDAILKSAVLDRNNLKPYIDRVPGGWMSLIAKSFAQELMAYNLLEIGKLVHE